MIIAGYWSKIGLKKIWFFKKTFLLAKTSMKIVIKILFSLFQMQKFGLEKKIKLGEVT